MKNYLKTQQNQLGQSIGCSLENNAPCQAIKGNIEGQYVTLTEIDGEISDLAADQIWASVSTEPNGGCWTYLPYSAPSSQAKLKQDLQNLFGFKDSTHFLLDIGGEIKGWIALLNPRLVHGVIEIGNVYFSHRMKQSKAATETIFLLLQKCFKNGFRRVEWKCDDCNEPSKTAALRFGFHYEGLFRQDRIIKGRNRNTAWFSMIDEEWNALESAYTQWLNPENFDENGSQLNKLSDFSGIE